MKKIFLFLFLVFLAKLNYATIVVTIATPPPYVDTICEGNSLNLFANVSGASSTVSYVWKLNNYQVSTDSIYHFTATIMGNNVIVVTATSGGETSTDTIVLYVNTVTSPLLSSMHDTVCSGTTFIVSPANGVNGVVPTGTTYSWPYPTVTGCILGMSSNIGASNINGTLTNVCNTPNTVIYTITPSSGTGCVGPTFTLNVLVLPQPIVTTNFDSIAVCAGDTTFVSASGASTYVWNNGITGSSFGVVPQTAMTFMVTGTNTYGCSKTATAHISIIPPVAAIGTITGSTNVVAGQQNVVYSVTPIANATSYIWTFPNGATGTNDSSIVAINFGPAATSGFITVKGVNQCGSGTTSSLYINVGTIVPSCSANFTLVADTTTPHHYFAVNNAGGVAPLQYVWSWGDGTANSTTAYPSHTYSVAGYYNICLTITDSTGCTNTYCDSTYLQKSTNSIISVDVIHQGTLGINTNEIANQIKLYPNPAKETLTIETPSTDQKIEIINLVGETVYTSTINKIKHVNVSAFANSVYILKLSTGKEIIVKKFIKD
ncbi:MAG: PKD domain-containing protein [Bacteroidota bacterium]